jgi:hypothetical protein
MFKAHHAALGSSKLMGSAIVGASLNARYAITGTPNRHYEISVISASGTIRFYAQQDTDTRHAEYSEQKEAFEAIPAHRLSRYADMWVIARNGEIVASNSDLNKMTAQYFRRAGDIAVYITRIGGEPEDYIDSPIEED